MSSEEERDHNTAWKCLWSLSAVCIMFSVLIRHLKAFCGHRLVENNDGDQKLVTVSSCIALIDRSPGLLFQPAAACRAHLLGAGSWPPWLSWAHLHVPQLKWPEQSRHHDEVEPLQSPCSCSYCSMSRLQLSCGCVRPELRLTCWLHLVLRAEPKQT